MPFTNSARGQVNGVLPTGPTQPALVSHLTGIVNTIEPKLIQWAASTAAVDAAGAVPNKMVVITDDYEMWMKQPSGWVKMWPTNFGGTAVPVAANFDDGDSYDRYA